MAAKRPISVTITGDYNDRDVNRAIRDLQSLKRQAGTTNPVVGALGKGVAGMMGAFAVGAVIGQVADFLQDAAKAAMADEASVRKLETAMRNLNAIGDLPKVEDGINKLSRAVGVADDELRPAFQRLMQATGDAETAQSALSTALDISAGTGKDLNTVTLALSKAYTGSASSLKRLGVPLDDALIKSKDMVAIQGELNRVFGGQAAAAAGTYSGQMKKIGVAVDEAKEAIGYALLQSIEDVTNAIGGAGGATQAIDNFGLQMANIVRGIGETTIMFINMGKAISDFAVSLGASREQVSGFGKGVKEVFLLMNPLLEAIEGWRTRGEDANKATAEMNASLRASEGYMRMYVSSVDPAAASTARLVVEQEDAAEAAKMLEEAFSDMDAAMSATGAMLSFRQSLNEIGDELKDRAKDITGFGTASVENKQLILSVFSDAQKAAQEWGKATGASTDEVVSKYRSLASKARRELIDNGINEKDLDKFLGDNEMWSRKINTLFGTAVKLSKDKVFTAGMSIGVEFADGVKKGIIIGTPSASAGAIDLVNGVRSAFGKGKGGSNWATATGQDLMKDLFKGINAASKTLRKDLRENFRSWFQDSSDSLKDALDKAQDDYDKWWAESVTPLEDALKEKKKLLDDFKKDVVSSITGMVSFRDMMPTAAEYDDEGVLTKAATTFIGNLTAQKDKIVKFTTDIKKLIAMGLNEQSIQQILNAGADAGGAIATELLDGGAEAIATTNTLMDSINTAADEVAVDGAAKWYQSGVDLAQAQLDGYLAANKPAQDAILQAATDAYNNFVKDYGPGGTKRAEVLNTIDEIVNDASKKAILKLDMKIRKKKIKEQINELFRDAGVAEKNLPFQGILDDPEERAKGGPVFRGRPYIVGERGPELFVPSDTGTIIPNGASYGAGGDVFNIAVTAGMGADGTEIGRAVVEAISKYERRSGRVYARA